MKNTLRYLMIAAIALGFSAAPSHADDEAVAALGGFLAGVITGVVIDDHGPHHRGPAVEVAIGSRHGRYDRHDRYGHRGRYDRYDRHRRSGHWEIRYVKVWIPGRHEYVRDACGRRIKVWRPGHHVKRPQKVWIAYNSKPHRGSYRG